MNDIKAVIFDMDGVVFNTEEVWRDSYQYANTIINSNITEEFRKSMCGRTRQAIIDEITSMYPDVDAYKYREICEKDVEIKLNKGDFEFKDGFLDLIKYLKEKGIKTALATSAKRDRMEAMFKIKGYDMSSLFDYNACGDDSNGHSKPDPYVYNLCSNNLDVKPENAIVCEDSLNGIRGAVNGGYISVMVIDLIEPDDFAKENAKYIVNNLNEVREIIEKR